MLHLLFTMNPNQDSSRIHIKYCLVSHTSLDVIGHITIANETRVQILTILRAVWQTTALLELKGRSVETANCHFGSR